MNRLASSRAPRATSEGLSAVWQARFIAVPMCSLDRNSRGIGRCFTYSRYTKAWCRRDCPQGGRHDIAEQPRRTSERTTEATRCPHDEGRHRDGRPGLRAAPHGYLERLRCPLSGLRVVAGSGCVLAAYWGSSPHARVETMPCPSLAGMPDGVGGWFLGLREGMPRGPTRRRPSPREPQKTRLRLLEGSSPSISRYLATVRRAILMPSSLARRSTIS